MAQEGPKRGPRGPQEGPKSAQERPKSGPTGPQEATFRAPTGGAEKEATSFLIDGLQDSPKRPPRPFQRAPRGPQQRPKRAPREPRESPRRAPPTVCIAKSAVWGWAGGDARSVNNSYGCWPPLQTPILIIWCVDHSSNTHMKSDRVWTHLQDII